MLLDINIHDEVKKKICMIKILLLDINIHDEAIKIYDIQGRAYIYIYLNIYYI